jgi:DNA-binding CsgD family transcriptional regulator
MAPVEPLEQNVDMPSALTMERVRRDVEVVASAGLDLPTFLAEIEGSIARVLRPVATCIATIDPATTIVTSDYKFGDLAGRDEHDMLWGLVEYGSDDPTTFADLAAVPGHAVGMHLHNNGDLMSSRRSREVTSGAYGYGDELRLVAAVDGRAWGGIAFYRGPSDEPFDEHDVAFASSLSPILGRGFRAGLLARAGQQVDRADAVDSSAAVIIVDGKDRITQISLGAEERLRQVMAHTRTAGFGPIAGLVAAARRYASGATTTVPRGRLRLHDGRWFVLQASPMASRDGVTGDVVITIEDARPPEIVPLVVEAFGLTARERDVTQLVLQGAETKEIATSLHVSPYTVQDHLKSIFTKAGVRSRRELMARVYFDQYLPRMGTQVGPSGWFTSPWTA